MKILFLHSLAHPQLGGGAEVVIWEQMRGMIDAGHECVLLATSPGRGLQRRVVEGVVVWEAGIRNVYWPFHRRRSSSLLRLCWHATDSYNTWMQGYVRTVLAEENPDLISLHNLAGWSSTTWRTLERAGVPSVQVLHDHYAICAKSTMHSRGINCVKQCVRCRVLRLPHRALSRKVQAVVGVSEFILKRHLSLGYFDGVPTQRVIHNVRSGAGLAGVGTIAPSHEGLRFGYIGRLEEAKGVEQLIDAFIAADLPHAELWLAGQGKQDYERRLHNLVVDKPVRFLGHVDVSDYYPMVDVIVVPSLVNESQSMVVAEALAYGKPVIGSRRGGIPEMICHGENGLLFEPNKPGELSELLNKMYVDRSLRHRLATAAQVSGAKFLDMNTWIGTYEMLYSEVIDSARP